MNPVSALLVFLGFASVTAGASLLSVAAGLIVGGVLLVVAGVAALNVGQRADGDGQPK